VRIQAKSEQRGTGPRIVVSRCLGFEACRYDGSMVQSSAVERLKAFCECVPVCPEMEIGLGVPRPPIRVVRGRDGDRLVQPETGRDLTEAMNCFAEEFLRSVGPVDGFVLKARSPSCGLGDVEVFAGPLFSRPLARRVSGFFARAVERRYPHLPVASEGRLEGPRVFDEFLTRVRAVALEVE